MTRADYILAICCAIIVALSICISRAHSAELAIGDSIAVGLQLPGTAKVGISPKEIVRRIGMTPLADLHGQIVVLSTGLSNDPKQSAYVLIQMKMLHAAGAKVILLGVGAAVKQSVEINKWLEAVADYNDIPFIDGWANIHPANYRVLLDNIRLVECQDYKICGA
jgi:hypothetical protein